MGEASRRYHIWDNVVDTLPKIQKPVESTPVQVKNTRNSINIVNQDEQQSKSLKANELKTIFSKNKNSPNCSTPLECYEEAYNMLIEAQKDIQYFKDLALQANITSMQANNTATSAIEVAERADQTANNSIAIGTIVSYSTSSPPAGWLVCDGSVLDIQNNPQFSSLAKLIGFSFDPNKVAYRLPDLRGRVIVGSGTGNGLSFRNIGSYFGEEVHTLTIAEMPYHSHSSDTGAAFVVHRSGSVSPGGGSDFDYAGSTNAVGGSQPHNNMQPSLVTNYIIKY
eukprot:TRINITY_DN500_c0_g1_i1.p1 TRINITY_DN500_c0_g1~~TRINITY_DN500_c0_g1_i1.p1  ORF type:complete len:330 (-),score=80.68 TRINITY_DN500_c0_g1_i1:48-890(-)